MKNQFFELKVLREGFTTTIQDFGFKNLQHLGITSGGAIDDFSYQLGNIILSNKITTPSIEFTKFGPKLLVKKGNLKIVITGNVDFTLTIDNKIIQGSVNRSYNITEGDLIDIRSTIDSNYGYLSIKNGLVSNLFKGSFSTLTNSKIGNKITINQILKGHISKKTLNYKIKDNFVENEKIIRVVKGPQMNYFKIKDIKKFYSNSFTITNKINRIGVRLTNNIIKPFKSFNIDSEGITKGTIQVPGDGNPIILASDHPTIGGYPKIATVIVADYYKIVQYPENTSFYFKEVSIDEAEILLNKYNNKLINMKKQLIKVD
tara:strand:+ start:918 stop:1868 length:951 start_codon:yes stop_codon:yes gene_type:complete